MDENLHAAVVQRVLELLDLVPIAGQQIGAAGGLNPEQRKCESSSPLHIVPLLKLL